MVYVLQMADEAKFCVTAVVANYINTKLAACLQVKLQHVPVQRFWSRTHSLWFSRDSLVSSKNSRQVHLLIEQMSQLSVY